MPSPFPGMDPYLEHPAIFPGLHDRFIAYLSEVLQGGLPEPYFAEIADRLWVEISDRSIGPDVNVLRTDQPDPQPEPLQESSGGTAVATATRAKPVTVHVPHDEHREPFLQIIARMEGERVVTTIEVLSLSNKTPGEQGRDLYLRKQKEILDSKVHLVEIDLLRAGEHTTAVPFDRAVRAAGKFDYHVCLHHFDNLEDYIVYPILMEQELPIVDVPLLPGDGSVPVDLQAVFKRCYDTGPYHRRIRYGETELDPPLDERRKSWAEKRVSGQSTS